MSSSDLLVSPLKGPNTLAGETGNAFLGADNDGQNSAGQFDLIAIAQTAIRLLQKYLLWWVLILLSALALSGVVTILTPPVYMASGSIQIDPDQSSVATVKDIVQEQRQSDNVAFMQTQYGKLKSRSLAERVATKIGPRKIIGEPSPDSAEKGKAARPGSSVAKSMATDELNLAVDTLLGSMRVAPVTGSRLVKVTYQSRDPQFAAFVVDTYVDEFISMNLQRRFEASAYARTFLEQRLETLRLKLETAESDLVNYATDAKIVNRPEGEDGRTVESPEQASYRSLTAAKALATQKRIEAEERLRAVRASRTGGATASQPNSALDNIRIERARAEAEYRDKLQILGPDYPAVRQLGARVAEYDRQLSLEVSRVKSTGTEAAASEAAAAIAVEARLALEVERLQLVSLDSDRRAIRYNILKRDLDTNKTLYDGLLQRYREIGVAGGIGVNNISIVDRAVIPKGPIQPRPFVNAILGLLLGSLVSGIVILLIETWGQTFRRPEQVTESLGLQVLGVIPKFQLNHDLMQELSSPRTPTTEAYHALRASIQFSQSSGMPKSIFFTSSLPSEGKSSSAIALAIVLARSGQRVCLVDADLRKPSVHRVMGLRNKVGLSSIILGEATIEQVVQPTVEKNLVVVVAGPELTNPAEYLSSTATRQAIGDFERAFDVVIFDGPPLLGLADAALLATQIETTVFVICANKASRSIARRAVGRIKNSRTNILGVVMTHFDYVKESYGGYGYDKSYGYQAYAYGSAGNKEAPPK